MLSRSLVFAVAGFAIAMCSPAGAVQVQSAATIDGVHTDAVEVVKPESHKVKKHAVRHHRLKHKVSARVQDAHESQFYDGVPVNNGELRSGKDTRQPDLLSALFGRQPKQELLPETRALDGVLRDKESHGKFRVTPALEPVEVSYTGYARGTIVIDTKQKYLYYVESSTRAKRYRIAVGREGLLFTGRAIVGDKQEWPRWIPTKEMQEREPVEFGRYRDGVPGSPSNPLGARAIYLYQDGVDTHIRIHGTNEPWSVGKAVSNGCFRMINDQVMELYRHVRMGTPVVVL